MNSLGVFHHSLSVSLASFAKQVSAGDHDRQSRPGQRRVDPTFTSFTQGRLRLHTALRTRRHDAPHCRFIICFVHGSAYHNGSTSTHKNRSPRKQGRGIHAIGNRPESASAKTRFLPASTQDWASQADTRSFTGVPFGGFLGPPSETADLTRILRRRLAHISIAWLAKICNSFRIYTERLTVCFKDPMSDFWRHLNSFPGPGPSCRLRCVRGRWSFSKQTTGRSSLPAA